MPAVGRSFRPSGAMVVALVALFFAVGGVGYAQKVVKLISGSQIKKGSIDLSRLSLAAQAALKGHAGARGLQGAQGPKGDQGPSTGPAGGALSGNFPNPSLAAGSVDTANFASGATAPNASKLGGTAASGFWQLAGNAATNPASDFLGTSDNQPLTLKVNGQRALLLQPDATGPNLIGGFSGNQLAADKHGVTIAGGGQPDSVQSVTDNFGTIAGGSGNTVTGTFSTASGNSNTAGSGSSSTAFGEFNRASGLASTAFGDNNTASGDGSTAFGNSNFAGGAGSFAGGDQAAVRSTGTGAPDDNSFVWSDGSGGGLPFSSSGTNQFDVRSIGGFTFQTNSGSTYSTGCQIAPGGGAWSCASDRHVKRGFAPISLQQLLRKIAGLWISTWSYKTDPSHTRHIGPVAQDFKSAFRVGNDPRSIGLLDEGGVALAGVKGLYQVVQQQQTEITALQAQLTALKRQR